MASKAVLDGLPSPLRDLVAAAAPNEEDFGTTEQEKSEVKDWISKVSVGELVKPSSAEELNATLTPRTYVIGNSLTAADVALYGALHPTISQLQPSQYYSHPAITRYFDHIQSRPSVRKAADGLAPAFAPVSFDLDNMPKIERKAAPAKQKKEKVKEMVQEAKESVVAAVEKVKEVVTGGAPTVKESAPKGKEKKEKAPKAKSAPAEGKKSGKSGTAAAAEEIGEPAPSMIDLRVGKIVDIRVHENADALYIEKIDVGEEEPRQIISGLVKYIPIEQMRDRHLVVICNLKPMKMRGVESSGMVLCATSSLGKDPEAGGGIEIVAPPEGSQPGDRIYFEGEQYENAKALPLLPPKKKIFETIQPGFITLDTREAAWVNPETKSEHKIRTAKGVCMAPSFVGASLS